MKVSLPKINSDRIKALTQKLMQDKHEKILEDLVDLERDNPEDMRVKQKIAELLYKQTNIKASIDKFKEIAAYYEKNDFILKAIRACQQILKIQPYLVEYNIKLGSLHLKLGMANEAANQYRITVNHFAHFGDVESTLKYSQILVKVDPSTDNKVKLAEIYQNSNMTNEAVSIYNELAQEAREKKQYDKLLHYYEMLLPHTPNSSTLLRDVCILSLRKQRPDHVLRLLDQYQAMDNRAFEDLVKKARLMREALRRQKK